MIKFSKLLNQLIFCSSNNDKKKILVNYFRDVNLTNAGYTVAALTNNLKFKNITNSKIKNIIIKNIDANLFALSYDYAGDLADTISLIWEKKNETKQEDISLSYIIKNLNENELNLEEYIVNFLNTHNIDERWAFIKLLLGGFRVGVSENFVKSSLALYGSKSKEDIEKIWHGLNPPYTVLFKWLNNEGPYPRIEKSQTFHSMMLASSINLENEAISINNSDYYAEYKWDGIRIQIVCKDSKTKVFSRSGDDITNSFPEVELDFKSLVVLDGELLPGKDSTPQSFGDLQKRLNKKNPSKKLISTNPVFVRLYDILFYEDEDLRDMQLKERKKKLNLCYSKIHTNKLFDLSEIIKFTNFKMLNDIYKGIEKSSFIEGLMIKKKNSIYISGRKKGYWLKWKRSPKFIDAILMYAQRGHGKRSSFYSDFTLGVLNNNKEVVPVAKAYSGYTDKELQILDKFVRENTINKFGPVREVEKKLVIELAFDSMQKSNRHKSGISLRFPRFHRIRWDKPVEQTLLLDEIKIEFIY